LLASAGIASAAPLYTENFDVNNSANWTFRSSIATDTSPNNNVGNEANFFFDYSTAGIPSAPNSIGGTTRGLKMEANIPGTGVFSGLSVFPNGQSFSGDFTVEFDAWQNYTTNGNGSTQMTNSGWGASGTTTQFAGGAINSVQFAASSDGGTNPDYRAYVGTSTVSSDTSGVYAAGNTAGVTNNTHSYYTTSFGGQPVPPSQTALYAQQTGTVPAGTQGLAWHRWLVEKSGNTVSWTIDGKRIATTDITGKTLGGTNIYFGQADINSGSSTDANGRALIFGLVDNVVVNQVPEPGALSLIAVAALPLMRRRRSKKI
jgi:hypothetical protein